MSNALLKSIKFDIMDLWSSKAEYTSDVNLLMVSKVFRPGRKPKCLLFNMLRLSSYLIGIFFIISSKILEKTGRMEIGR